MTDVTDGLQPADMERLRVYETRQSIDLLRIQQTAIQLSALLSNYHKDHGQMLDVKQIKVIEHGEASTRLEIG